MFLVRGRMMMPRYPPAENESGGGRWLRRTWGGASGSSE